MFSAEVISRTHFIRSSHLQRLQCRNTSIPIIYSTVLHEVSGLSILNSRRDAPELSTSGVRDPFLDRILNTVLDRLTAPQHK